MSEELEHAKQLNHWVKSKHIELNLEKLNEIYLKLGDLLDTILGSWAFSSDTKVIYEVITLLLPSEEPNLFSALWSEQANKYQHPLPFKFLPQYLQNSFKRRTWQSVPGMFSEVMYDQEIVMLSTRNYYLCRLMHEALNKQQRSWSEADTFLDDLYSNPFLILYGKMLQVLGEASLNNLLEVSTEYLLKDWVELDTPPKMPNKVQCELLHTLIYMLQKPEMLLPATHRIQAIQFDSFLFSLKEHLYWFFKNCSLKWREGDCYPSFLVGVWAKYLTPWKLSSFMEEFLCFDFISTREEPQSYQEFTGFETFWEDYIYENLLFYTEIFEYMLRLMCSELVFRSGDLQLLCDLSELYLVDNEGFIINKHLSLASLADLSERGPLPPQIESIVSAHRIPRQALCPFNSSQLKSIVENLIFKCLSTKCREAYIIKKNFSRLMGITQVREEVPKHGVLMRRPVSLKSLLNVWEKPCRADEVWVLLQLSKQLAYALDKVLGYKTVPPTTNLRFLASLSNWLFLCLLGLMIGLVFGNFLNFL